MTEETPLTAEERVELGAAYLDSVAMDDWFDVVEIKELDMNSTCDCVLGQVGAALLGERGMRSAYPFYGFIKGSCYSVGPIVDETLTALEAERYGFDCGTNVSFAELAVAWERMIEKRRAEAGTMLDGS